MYHGDLVADVDESTPEIGGGIVYVLAGAVLLDPPPVVTALETLLRERSSPRFHWHRESSSKRFEICDLIIANEITATCFWRSVHRKGQSAARQQIIAAVARWASNEQVSHLIIESGNRHSDRRDEAAIREIQRTENISFPYDHRSKSEPLLCIADAIAGAAGAYLTEKDKRYYDKLAAGNVITLEQC